MKKRQGKKKDENPVVAPLRTKRQEPSISDVAKAVGVSIATVSRVLNSVSGGASESTARRVREAAERIGYRINGAGAALRGQRSRIVALLIPDIRNTYVAAVTVAIERELRNHGLITVICEIGDEPDAQDNFLKEMKSQKAAGIIVFGCVKSPVLEQFVTAREPIIFIHRKSPYPVPGIFVGIDNYQAAYEVGRRLIERDLFPFVAIYGVSDSSAASERVAGLRAAVTEMGLTLPQGHVLHAKGADFMLAGFSVAAGLFKTENRPRAIVCTSDLLAYGVYRAAQEHGYQIPDEVVIYSFEDNPLNSYIAGWLNAVTIPIDEVGTTAVELLMGLWAGKVSAGTQIILPHALNERN